MLHEPRLAVFYSPPKHDLQLAYDLEKKEECAQEQVPWPDVINLFGDDPEYQGLINSVMEYITNAMCDVSDYIQVLLLFCYLYILFMKLS